MSNMTREDAQQLITDNLSEIDRLLESVIKTAKENNIWFELDIPDSSYFDLLRDGVRQIPYNEGWSSSNC